MSASLSTVTLLALAAAVTLRAQAVARCRGPCARVDAIADRDLPGRRRRCAAICTSIPELGFRETRTAGHRRRPAAGAEVRRGAHRRRRHGRRRRAARAASRARSWRFAPTWTRCRFPSSSTCRTSRSSPNVKHACGHDGHTAIALGVAEILSRLRADLPGTVVFLFQPAEEGDPDGGPTGARARARRTGRSRIRRRRRSSACTSCRRCTSADRREQRRRRWPAPIGSPSRSSARRRTARCRTPASIRFRSRREVVMAFQTIPSRQIDAQEPTVVTVGTIDGGTALQRHRRQRDDDRAPCGRSARTARRR